MHVIRMVQRITIIALLMTAVGCGKKPEEGPVAAAPDKNHSPKQPAPIVADDPRTQENLESIARQLNPTEPVMVDAVTRLDRVEARDDAKTLLFTYTVVDRTLSKQLPASSSDWRKKKFEEVCLGRAQSKVLRDGFLLNMVYFSVAGAKLAEFTFDPAQCDQE